jgi:putative membrane protein insertion efficiency factor
MSSLDTLRELPRNLLIGLVRGYRFFLKPWLGNACRFEPTCSAYSLQALQRHGALRGSVLTGWRLLRCQPWCDGGCDPVPERFPNPAAGLFTRLRAPAPDADPPTRNLP